MQRHTLRGDQWDMIKDFLPGRVRHLLRLLSTIIAPVALGVTCWSDLALVKRYIGVIGGDARQAKANRKMPRETNFALYCEQNLVESFFNKIKQYRAIATRFDKCASTFLAGVLLVSIVLWLN